MKPFDLAMGDLQVAQSDLKRSIIIDLSVQLDNESFLTWHITAKNEHSHAQLSCED
jgi:hypothetical protein